MCLPIGGPLVCVPGTTRGCSLDEQLEIDAAAPQDEALTAHTAAPPLPRRCPSVSSTLASPALLKYAWCHSGTLRSITATFPRRLSLQAYPGFNLMAADLAGGRLLYLCNRQHAGSSSGSEGSGEGGEKSSGGRRGGGGSNNEGGGKRREGEECAVVEIPPGVHGITNGHMDARWPKVGGRTRLVDGGWLVAAAVGLCAGRLTAWHGCQCGEWQWH